MIRQYGMVLQSQDAEGGTKSPIAGGKKVKIQKPKNSRAVNTLRKAVKVAARQERESRYTARNASNTLIR